MESTQIYAENDVVNNLVINGVELTQETREGYNEIQNEIETSSMSGVDIIRNSDGSVTLNGTATENITLYYSTKEIILNGTYIFYLYGKNGYNINLQGIENGSKVAYLTYSSSEKYVKRVYDTDTILSAFFSYIAIGKTFNNETFYPMITKGEEVKPYEEYGASPSIDFPSEVQVASEQNIQICQNNYLNTTQIANKDFSNNGLTVTTDENGIFTVNGTHSEQVNIDFNNLDFNVKENQVIKFVPLGGNVNYQENILNCINSVLWNKDWKTLALLNLNNSLITSSDTVKYFQVRFIIPGQQSSITYTNFKFGIMVVNSDDNIQDYQPYYGTDITIPLTNSAIGQYADTIDRENNVQNKVIQELILTGDEYWTMAYGDGMFGLENSEIKFNINSKIALSNYFKFNSTTSNIYNTLLDNEFAFQFSNGKQKCFIKCIQFNSVTDWKAKLKELYQAGTPVKIYYVSENPTTNPLSEEVQTALSNFKLYQDLNNVSIDGGSMSFLYNKSLSKTIEEMQDEIQSKDTLIQNLTTRVEALEKAQVDNVGGN